MENDGELIPLLSAKILRPATYVNGKRWEVFAVLRKARIGDLVRYFFPDFPGGFLERKNDTRKARKTTTLAEATQSRETVGLRSIDN